MAALAPEPQAPRRAVDARRVWLERDRLLTHLFFIFVEMLRFASVLFL
jgi:hypothetical protein